MNKRIDSWSRRYMSMEGEGRNNLWTWEENKIFEMALIPNCIETMNSSKQFEFWEEIAGQVHGKTVDDVKHHFELLLEDINNIDLGLVDLPDYRCSSKFCTNHLAQPEQGKAYSPVPSIIISATNMNTQHTELERRRAIAWTEDEHRLFLQGLDMYGRGDWRSISRNLVITRTPTQVASHAQKYYKRLKSSGKEKRRSSIHDIKIKQQISTENDHTQQPKPAQRK